MLELKIKINFVKTGVAQIILFFPIIFKRTENFSQRTNLIEYFLPEITLKVEDLFFLIQNR